MLMTTTEKIENFYIREYLGVVFSSKVVAVGITGDIAAKITDFLGGAVGRYEGVLDKGVQECLEKLYKTASQEGANAVISVNIELSTFSTTKGGFFVILCKGTAVKGGYNR